MDIAIVGGGIGGLTLALALHQRGIPCRVYESASVVKELARREILVDYRPGAGIRVSPHFYTTDEEVAHVVSQIAEIVETGAWKTHATGQGAAY